MQSRRQVRLSTFERPKQEEIPPQRRPGPSRTSEHPHPPHFAGSWWAGKQNAHTRLCQQVARKHSCTCEPCRQSHMLATHKHVTCQTLAQVQTCARPSISYAHTSHLDTRTRAPRGKYLSYAAHHNTKARKQAHRTVRTITCKHMCSAPHFSTLRWWRYDESHAIPKASETLDLRTAQTRRDPSSKKARAESNIPTPPQANETLAATQTASPKAESLLLPWVPRTQSL